MTCFDHALRDVLLHPSTRSHLRHVRSRTPNRTHPGPASSLLAFRTEVEQSPDIQLLRLKGELEAGGAEILAAVLSCERNIAASRGAELRLDLDDVTYMDLPALEVLLGAKRASAAAGQAFTVGPAGEAVVRLLDAAEATDLVRDPAPVSV